jgi:acyl transferase domain-containing protein
MVSKIAPQEPIAIVGSACRFAGDANSPSKLWDLLREPRDIRSEIPDSRFNASSFYHPDSAHHGRSNVKHSYLLNEDPTVFDAEFFGINPIEARAMDPQQRILLETVYEAVESAGMTLDGLKGSDTAVYAGVMIGDYEAMLLRDLDAAPTYFAVGTSRAILSNRVSYFFDWHGAAVTIDTACSSSLVAVHSAIQTLRAGDSRMAVACGANVILGPETYIIESKLKMLSPDGRGRMWDKDANGYARGDGVAAILLKTLSAAIADGDHIECIIRETGLNQDGTTTGLTMPSAAAQRALIESTYAKAGLNINAPADRPQFFEAHGTGTPAGGK